MSSVDELPWAWAFSDYRPKKKADIPCRIAPLKPCQPPMQSTDAILDLQRNQSSLLKLNLNKYGYWNCLKTRIIYVKEAEECNRIHYSDYEYLN